jgi:hypothetical protein
MNFYSQDIVIPNDKAAQVEAIDEATNKHIPTDILKYVIQPMLDEEIISTETP